MYMLHVPKTLYHKVGSRYERHHTKIAGLVADNKSEHIVAKGLQVPDVLSLGRIGAIGVVLLRLLKDSFRDSVRCS